MKFQRQAAILDIISQNEITTQEELAERLKEMGYTSTQATISRDIKELRLVKTATANGEYRYSVAKDESDAGFVPRVENIFRECVIKVDCAQNLVVIKTITGMANAAAFALDSMKIAEIMGTIAGDDNVLIILKDNERALSFFEQTKQMLR